MQKKFVQYTLLALIVGGLLFTSFLVKEKLLRFIIVLSVSLVYLLFGLLHHYEDKTLSEKVFWEYLALSSLAFIVLYSFLVAGR